MLELLAANAGGKIRYATMNGREYLVAPLRLIVPGVLEGSDGKIFYSKEENAKDAAAWNGVPLVAYHPYKDGKPVSARHPEVLNAQGLGFVFGTNAADNLDAEGWFDVVATESFDRKLASTDRILPKLKAGQSIELSTGLFLQRHAEAGVFNGREYTHVARNYKPDHVAVLPDQTGACSLKDGCGVLVNCGGKGGTPGPCKTSRTDISSHAHELSAKARTADEHKAAGEAHRDAAKEIRKTSAVARASDNQYSVEHGHEQLKKAQKHDDAASKHETLHSIMKQYPKLSHEQAVEQRRSMVGNSLNSNGERTMAMTAVQREEAVAFLVANCDCWKGQEDELRGMTDARLEAHKAETLRRIELEKTVPTGNSGLSAEDREALNYARNQRDSAKSDLVVRLTANVSDPTERAKKHLELMGKPLTELENYAALMPAAAPPAGTTMFMGGGTVNIGAKQPTINKDNHLETPEIDWSKPAE